MHGPDPGIPHPPALQRQGKAGGGLRRAGRGQRLIARRASLPAWTAYDEYARALRVLCVHTLPCTVCSHLYSRRTELALLPGAFRALLRSRGWPRIQLCGCRAALAILGVLSPQLSDVGHVEVGCLRLQEQEFRAVRPAQLDPALGSSPASAWRRVGVMMPYFNMLNHEHGTA